MGIPVKIIDRTTLDRFSGVLCCEWCKEITFCHAHHTVVTKGAGGWSRLDIPINLTSLCAKQCHPAYHNGVIPKEDLVRIIAKREKTTVDKIEEEIRVILRGEYHD